MNHAVRYIGIYTTNIISVSRQLDDHSMILITLSVNDVPHIDR